MPGRLKWSPYSLAATARFCLGSCKCGAIGMACLQHGGIAKSRLTKYSLRSGDSPCRRCPGVNRNSVNQSTHQTVECTTKCFPPSTAPPCAEWRGHSRKMFCNVRFQVSICCSCTPNKTESFNGISRMYLSECPFVPCSRPTRRRICFSAEMFYSVEQMAERERRNI